MAIVFTITKNQYLSKNIAGYHNLYYTGYLQPENPDFINTLKNTYNNTSLFDLQKSRDKVIEIILSDIPTIMTTNGFKYCTCVCIPRAKALNTYTDNQLFFRDAVRSASSQMAGVIDGSDVIVRHTNTFTTHFRSTEHPSRVTRAGSATVTIQGNDGPRPYPGITKATCHIDKNSINGNNIILIDDIYTIGANVDEDAIQALFDAGAKNVIFYSIAYTRRD